MLDKYRHRTLMILIIVLVSVFLYSCGEPTFCELNGITITKISNESFSVTGADEDLTKIEHGPALILCYYIAYDSEDNISGINSKIISAFKTEASPVLIVNTEDSSITSVSGISGAVYDSYTLYAFTDTSSNAPQRPLYNINLGAYITNISCNAVFTLSIDKENKQLTVNDGTNDFTFCYPYSDHTGGKTLVLLAAFTSGVGDFSYIYWSELKPIGSFDIYDSE